MLGDFAAVREGRLRYAEAVRELTLPGLRTLMTDLFAEVDTLLAGLTDDEVTFVPDDAEANDTFAAPGTEVTMAWTLGHVVVHFTAGLEENAALATTLARGIPVEGRSRYEVPWKSVTTAGQAFDRLAESKRMCLALLDAWPDQPHLELTMDRFRSIGPMNAISLAAIGVLHAESHLAQLRETRRQAAEAARVG